MADDEVNDEEETLFQRQKRERKQLQGEIQKLKHTVPKGDKKKKKEITEQIAKLQADLDLKHKQEEEALEANTQQTEEVTTELESVTVDDSREITADENQHNPSRGKKMSKAQKRRDKKSQKDKDRNDQIAEQAKENQHGPRHLETQKLKTLLGQRGLQIHEIASDGNCLYNALVHQLEHRKLKSSNEMLRQQTADYMKEHTDDFMPFLTKPDTGNPYSLDEFEQYCNDVATTSAWGGHLELRALSHILKSQIEVIQADAPPIIMGEEFHTNPLIVTYHRHAYGLGEHYNSVAEKTADKDATSGFS
ncbi:deubiquitinase OTUD6B-like [Gigantopelta aegis]|uniref:deubiquitinase OTUD6B-like n=1 Tax=Gigantopelta aegis TaxID=1735272 RepID=UPI001B88B457|nr:deubiquitinase OTUD6B-like [Gigantopelta aegis]